MPTVAMKPCRHESHHPSRIAPVVCLCLRVLLFAGCGKTEPPQFHAERGGHRQGATLHPNSSKRSPTSCDAMFGTPDEPFVLPDTGLDLKKIRVAAGPVRSDEFGRETGLYRRHCGHCHGTTGDGLGPTAMILNPYPRDYRQGKFKFKSTERPTKPTDDDLELVLRNGVPGTAMPSFDLLPDAQIKALVEYVKYLSIRGETEIRLIDAIADLSEGEKLPIARADAGRRDPEAACRESWTTAVREHHSAAGEACRSNWPRRSPRARAVLRHQGQLCEVPRPQRPGRRPDERLRRLEQADHGIDQGLGWRRDAGCEPTVDLSSEERSARAAHVAAVSAALATDSLPPRTATPRNLRQGIYRGGRRPVDIYRRIYAGINGMPMPAVGPATSGRQGDAGTRGDLEPGRLRPVAAVRANQPATPPEADHAEPGQVLN